LNTFEPRFEISNIPVLFNDGESGLFMEGTSQYNLYNVYIHDGHQGVINLGTQRLTENEFSDFSLLWHDGCDQQSTRHNMWTEITRRKYEREGQRYASDVTDAEWALIEPQMPASKRLGRPRETELRAVLDAILYIARTGCQWRMLPKETFPRSRRCKATDWFDSCGARGARFTVAHHGRRGDPWPTTTPNPGNVG
jgi:hypothetical protein